MKNILSIIIFFISLICTFCDNHSVTSENKANNKNIFTSHKNNLAFIKQKRNNWAKYHKKKKGTWKIAILRTEPPYAQKIEASLKKSLKKMGYIHGKKIYFLTTKIVSPKVEGFPKTAKILKDILKKNVDLIATIGTQASVPCWQILKDTNIPMVFAGVTFPIEGKMIEAFNSPTRKNITGISYHVSVEKRLKLIRKFFPDAKKYKKIAFVYSSHTLQDFIYAKKIKLLKNKSNWDFIYIDIFDDIQETISSNLLINKLKEKKPDIIFGWYTLDKLSANLEIIKFILKKYPKPFIGGTIDFIRNGAIGSVLALQNKIGFHQATMIDKIIKGKFAGDIPPFEPKEYSLALNLKIAKKFNIFFPKNILKKAILIR